MDTFELKKEQSKLAPRVILKDSSRTLKTIGGAECVTVGEKLLACITVCEFPSLTLLEHKTFLLHNPLPYRPGFRAYRQMPALIEAFNDLEQEPDLLLVNGHGISHPRRIGIASHIGLALNKPTIGVAEKLITGIVENGKIINREEVVGFEVTTREHARPVYVSPGHLTSLGSVLQLIPQTIKYPHKLPEPLHLAHKIAKKKMKGLQ